MTTEKAEPVAWRWRHVNDASQLWKYQTQPIESHSEYLQVTPLYAAPPRCDAQSASVVTAAKALLAEVERTSDVFSWLSPIADLKRAVTLSATKPAQGDAGFPMNDADRVDILASAMRAINRATLNGDICDDVAWFDQIETLHEFCERILALTVRGEPIAAGGGARSGEQRALRDIISIAKDAQATDALGDIVRRAEEELND